MFMRNFNRVLILMAAPALALLAQSDPPSRVGRLNYISGVVSMQPAGVDDWVDANLNRPLTTGDRVWVDQDGRAEMHVGAAALRLNSRTAFEFLNLDDNSVQIRLTEGTLSITLRRLDENETFEVDTPNLAFSLLRPGEYRIDASPDSATTVITVREGQGEVTGGNQDFTVNPRQQAHVIGLDNVSYDVLDAPGLDGWDQWCRGRERREEQSQSARYVSREVVGYQDLDDYGDWQPEADYGTVWVPRGVAAGWSPYHYGRWAWIEPWGWTWVDDAPWGFAPFHYGRWIYAGHWAWVPGPVVVRPVYAPALVAWVGGSRLSLSFGFGAAEGVAWFPLGPREVYVPAYRASTTYVTRINNSSTVVNIRYVNQNAPGAIIAVPRGAFAGARPVQQVSVNVNVRQVQQGQMMNTAPVVPQRESVLGRAAGASGGVARPPAAVVNRQVVAKTTPPPPPIPFERRQPALAGSPGHPLEPAAVQSIRSSQPVTRRNWIRPAEAVHTQGPAPERQRPGNVDQPQRVQQDNGGQRPQQPRDAEQQRVQREQQQQRQRDAEQQRLQREQQQPRDAEQQRLQREQEQQRVQREQQQQQQRDAEQQRLRRDQEQQRVQREQQQQQQQRDAEQQRLQREQQQQHQREAEQQRLQRDQEQQRLQREQEQQRRQQPRAEPREEKHQEKPAEKDKAEKDKKPPQ